MTTTVCLIGNAQSIHVRRWADSLVRQGWDVTVYGPFAVDEAAFRSVAWTSRSGNSWGRWLHAPSQLREFKSFLSDGGFDLVWLHEVNQGRRMRWLPKSIPLVVTVYGSDVIPVLGEVDTTPPDALVALVLKRARVVTAASEYLAGLTARRYGGAADKMAIVPFGVDTTLFHPPELSSSLETKPLLVFAKHMKSIYGLEVLIRAVAVTSKQRGVPCEVLAMGGGDRPAVPSLRANLALRMP